MSCRQQMYGSSTLAQLSQLELQLRLDQADVIVTGRAWPCSALSDAALT
jgi:hypothetical protein